MDYVKARAFEQMALHHESPMSDGADSAFAYEWDEIQWDSIEGLEEDGEDLEEAALEVLAELEDNYQASIRQCQKFDNWFDRVAQLRETSLGKEWEALDAKQFVQVIASLGTEAADYLERLTVRIPNDDMNNTPGLQKMRRMRFKHTSSVVLVPHTELEQSASTASMRARRTFGYRLRRLLSYRCTFRAQAGFHYCGAWRLFTKDPTAQAYMLKALVDADASVFKTVICRALVKAGWDDVKNMIARGWIYDAVFILLLVLLAAKVRMHRYPEPVLLLLALFMACLKVVEKAIEAMMTCRMYGFTCAAIRKYCNSYWNLLFVFFDGYVCAFTFVMVYKTYTDAGFKNRQHCDSDSCYLFRHPVLFSNACLFKWFELIVSLLATRGFGGSVLPTFLAVCSKESLCYLGFLSICVLATFHAYYSYPIEEHLPGKQDTPFDLLLFAFLKIFRLDILGDFDLWELEGVDDVVEGSINTTSGLIDAGIDEGQRNRQFHRGIRELFFVCSVMITVMAMNVYIGLLGNIYTDLKAQEFENHARFRANKACRLMLWRTKFSPWSCLVSSEEDELPEERGGVVIAFATKAFPEDVIPWTADSAEADGVRRRGRA
mmetsp:Transcript_70114/g.194997  ORF Transcript_70114/g.194997 Transcript_70114/m.194997 type:complete len:604 (-) Transcript_70114:174-1985(-)